VIVTLTPNPSVDRTVALGSPLERGAVLRAEKVTAEAGGKGVNISRAAVVAGVPTIAVLPAERDDPYVLELLRDGIDCRPERPVGPVRVNITITEPDGTTTKINSPGTAVDRASLSRLAQAVHQRARHARWVVLAGSLPPGAPAGWYAELVRDLAGTAARVAVDTSGTPLHALATQVLSGGVAPDLIKPNGEELASLTGCDATGLESDPSAAAAAAAQLVEAGVGAVLATLGGNGAVLVTPEGSWHAAAPPTTVVSTVGAGDSSLFGYLLGDLRGAGPTGCLQLAVAYGSVAAGLPGTTIPRPVDVAPERVELHELARTAI
jgi:1-phosphofructokinase